MLVLVALLAILWLVCYLPARGQDRIVNRPRFSSFLPSDLANQVAWFKADSITANDGDAVTTWSDSFSTAHDVTQPTSTKRPVYKTSIVNGKPVLRFDGTDDLLRSASAFTFSGTTASIFVVSTGSSTANGNAVNIDDGGTTFYEFRVDSTTSLAFRPFNTSSATCEGTKSQSGTWRLMAGIKDASNSTAYANGVAGTPTACSGTQRSGSTKIQVGEFGLGFQFFGGDIAEIIIYDTALNSTDRQKVETYLNAKYAIY